MGVLPQVESVLGVPGGCRISRFEDPTPLYFVSIGGLHLTAKPCKTIQNPTKLPLLAQHGPCKTQGLTQHGLQNPAKPCKTLQNYLSDSPPIPLMGIGPPSWVGGHA